MVLTHIFLLTDYTVRQILVKAELHFLISFDLFLDLYDLSFVIEHRPVCTWQGIDIG